MFLVYFSSSTVRYIRLTSKSAFEHTGNMAYRVASLRTEKKIARVIDSSRILGTATIAVVRRCECLDTGSSTAELDCAVSGECVTHIRVAADKKL